MLLLLVMLVMVGAGVVIVVVRHHQVLVVQTGSVGAAAGVFVAAAIGRVDDEGTSRTEAAGVQ